jgi:hypoxanthine phosphoribosyltransferase
VHKDFKEILVSEEQINQRCLEMGKEITEYYTKRGSIPLLVSVLKGSSFFLTELSKRIDMDIEVDFMCMESYHGTESTGDVHIVMDLDRSIQDCDILLIEDIVDTGKTLMKVKGILNNKGAREVKVASLLDKPSRRKVEVNADFVGFVIPDKFVVGFGLDFNQKYRNLPYIGVLKEELYQ